MKTIKNLNYDGWYQGIHLLKIMGKPRYFNEF